MTNAGPLIGTYGKSRSLQFAWYFLALLFAGTGAFVLSLIPRFGHDIKFTGDPALPYAIGFGGIGIATLICATTFILLRSQPAFLLYEEAIRVIRGKSDQTDRYADVEDLFLYPYGGFAFRRSPETPWVFAGGRVSRYAELTARLVEAHAKQRGERLFSELMNGHTIRFRCLPDRAAFSKSVIATRNLDYPTHDLVLTRHHMTVQGKSIPVKRIADMTTNWWIERSEIIDVDGNVFHKMHPAAIMSFHVLLELIGRLQQEPALA